MHELILSCVIVFVASTLQAAIGFGFAIMATPFLLLVYNSADVVLMSNILSLINAAIIMPKIKMDIDYVLLKRLIYGSILGVMAGLLFFIHASLDTLKITVSIVILTVTLSLSFRWIANHFKFANSKGSCKKAKESSNCSETSKEKVKELLIGLCSGVLTTGIGMPGVPLALYFNAKNTPKVIVRSTTLAFFIAVYITSIFSQILAEKMTLDILSSTVMLIPASIAGVFLGNAFFYKINQNMFQIMANIILLFTGFYMLLEAL